MQFSAVINIGHYWNITVGVEFENSTFFARSIKQLKNNLGQFSTKAPHICRTVIGPYYLPCTVYPCTE